MKNLIAPLLITLFAAAAFAATPAQPEAQSSGSAGPKAAAESTHLAKPHGTDKSAKQPMAQAAGSEKAQAAAEAKHMKKKHGKVNDSADKRLEKDHPNH
jgi:hypothetical protein